MTAQEEPIRAKAVDVSATAPAHAPKPADPCALVIFGASGDLTKRLLVPALYNLARTKVLPDSFALIGVSRGEMKPEDWAKDLHDFLAQTLKGEAIDEKAWSRLAKAMMYVAGDVTAVARTRRRTALCGRIPADHQRAQRRAKKQGPGPAARSPRGQHVPGDLPGVLERV